MCRKLLLIILLNYIHSLSIAQVSLNDPVQYAKAHDSIHHIVFDFPAGWETRTNIPRVMFYAQDTTMSFKNFRTNLIYMSRRKFSELSKTLDWQAKALEKHSKHIVITEKLILQNQHGIEYGRLKNYSSHKGLIGYKTHIIFAKGDSFYLITFANLETDEQKYFPVVEHIIQSLQFYGPADKKEDDEHSDK